MIPITQHTIPDTTITYEVDEQAEEQQARRAKQIDDMLPEEFEQMVGAAMRGEFIAIDEQGKTGYTEDKDGIAHMSEEEFEKLQERALRGELVGQDELSDVEQTESAEYFISGALSPDSERADDHAVRYYEFVRRTTTDSEKIASSTDLSVEQIDAVKRFLFIDEHQLLTGVSRFHPDYMIAQSWQRLSEGRDIQPHDLTLLRHEIMESELMAADHTQADAHDITNEKYNYQKEAKQYHYGDTKKHPKD